MIPCALLGDSAFGSYVRGSNEADSSSRSALRSSVSGGSPPAANVVLILRKTAIAKTSGATASGGPMKSIFGSGGDSVVAIGDAAQVAARTAMAKKLTHSGAWCIMALLTYGLWRLIASVSSVALTKFTTMRLPSSGKRWYPPVTLASHGLV